MRDERLEVVSVERLDEAAMEFDVALGHACSPSQVNARPRPSLWVWLRGKTEVGKRPVGVPVPNHPRDLAVVDVQEERSLRRQLRDLESARLAASAAAVEHEHSLALDFT